MSVFRSVRFIVWETKTDYQQESVFPLLVLLKLLQKWKRNTELFVLFKPEIPFQVSIVCYNSHALWVAS